MKGDACAEVYERLPPGGAPFGEAPVGRHGACLNEGVDDLGADFKAAGADGGADGGAEPGEPGWVGGEPGDRRRRHRRDDATPPGMHRRDGARGRIGEEDRHAVGGADADGRLARKRNKTIGFRRFRAGSTGDDGPPVDLLHLANGAKARRRLEGAQGVGAAVGVEGVVARGTFAPEAEAVAERSEQRRAEGRVVRHRGEDSERIGV